MRRLLAAALLLALPVLARAQVAPNGISNPALLAAQVAGAAQTSKNGSDFTSPAVVRSNIGLGTVNPNLNITLNNAFTAAQSEFSSTDAIFGASNATGEMSPFKVYIGGDRAAAPNGVLDGIEVLYGMGGSGFSGYRNGIASTIAVNGPIAVGGNYVSMQSTGYATTNAGGTGVYTGGLIDQGYIGGIWGGNDNVWLATGSTNWRGVYGRETDVGIQPGASSFAKIGDLIVLAGQDAVRGIGDDAGVALTAQNPRSPGFKTGFQIGVTWGQFPLAADSTIMRSQQQLYPTPGPIPAVLNGIDLRNMMIGGQAFATDEFSVAGPTGAVSAGAMTLDGPLASVVGVSSVTAAAGGSYISMPTITIAPPTSGQAAVAHIANAKLSQIVSVDVPGTGYKVGDVLTASEAACTTQSQVSVTSISGGGASGPITGLSSHGPGACTSFGGSVALSGGSGTGAKATLAYYITSYAIDYGGKGYVLGAAPIVTISTSPLGNATATAAVSADLQITPGATGSTRVSGDLNFSGKIGSTAGVPTLSEGTLSPGSNDVRGSLTEGATQTGDVVTFSNPYSTIPFCVVSSPLGSPIASYTPTVSSLTINNPSGSGYAYTYMCMQ